jgi:hypothetical protein
MSTHPGRLALSSFAGLAVALALAAATSPARADAMCGGAHPPPRDPTPSPSTAPSSSTGPFARPPVGLQDAAPRDTSRSAAEFGMVGGMAFLGVFAGLSSRKKTANPTG